MATIHDLLELTSVSPNATYSNANGGLVGVVDNVTSSELDDGEFDEGDIIFIGGVGYSIDHIQEPSSNGSLLLGDGSTRTFGPGAESNLQVIFLTVSNGGDVRHFIIPNDSFGDLNIQGVSTGNLTDVGGNDAAVISTTNNQIEVVCFASGTLIETGGGRQVEVERLRVGDCVMTADHGLKQIRWIGRQLIAADVLAVENRLRPIRIRKDALGDGTPTRDLRVSPQHRILVRSRIAERMFGQPEVLIAAKHLTALPGIDVMDDGADVEYHHILLDAHEVVMANGAASESFFLGPQAMKTVSEQDRGIIRSLWSTKASLDPCRPLVTGKQARTLVTRHAKNRKPVVVAPGAALAWQKTMGKGTVVRKLAAHPARRPENTPAPLAFLREAGTYH